MSLFSRRALPPKVALQLAETHLGSAKQADDPVLKWSLCVNADKELSRIKKSARNALITSRKPEDQEICSRISEAYAEHVRILVSLRSVKQSKVKRSFINMIKWYIQKRVERAIDSTPDTSPAPTEPVINQQSVIDDAQDNSDTTQSPSDINSQIISDNSNTNIPESVTGSATASGDSTQVTPSIFLLNTPGPEIPYHLPSPDEPITSTPQLVYCLRLLSMDVPSTIESNKPLSETERWIRSRANDVEEKERLHLLSKKILAEFMSDELKDSAAVAEVIYLAPVLDKEYYRKLLNKFIDGIDRSTLLDFSLLEGLAQQIQCAPPECLHHDDLVKILDSLRVRLQSTHQQSTNHLYQLTVAISRVLDAMADSDVKGLKREELHAPLLKYLRELKDSSDPYLVFQAAYAHQALQYIPDDETQWKSLLRHTKMVVGGIAGIVTAVKKLDVNEFLNSLDHIHDGLWEVCKFAKTTYDEFKPLFESGMGFIDILKDCLLTSKVRSWYLLLRGANAFLQSGRLPDFKKLVHAEKHRYDPVFQWGLCLMLGDFIANPLWEVGTRRDAVDFLVGLYKNDTDWGQHNTIVKQMILVTLIQLSKGSDDYIKKYSDKQLLCLKTEGGKQKQALYETCINERPPDYPLKIGLPPLASSSLLDRIQAVPGLDENLRNLKRQRMLSRGKDIYIPPQANANLQPSKDAQFALMEEVQKFFLSEKKVLLLLGNSGAGKSTFTMELEYDIWNRHEKKQDAIPLHIHLPAIDIPEHDLIAKQLRKHDLTEPQIREIKRNNEIVLICDGYDESQQVHNLYVSNQLNQPGQWKARMVISCRTEYLGPDYRDRFQPMDKNNRGLPDLFQEAVIAPFSKSQIEKYIQQYVSLTCPQWRMEDYEGALINIPNLMDIVQNPFLLTLTLEVLPRVMDVGKYSSIDKITRIMLYDQFVEQWLERGKRRVGGKALDFYAKKVLNSLVDEGFTQSGLIFLKKLAAAIYKEQRGQEVVEYRRFADEGTWKTRFFNHDDETEVLREASPLIRNGYQHRFIHHSLLEYFFSCSVFDPREAKFSKQNYNLVRRRSVSSIRSTLSFEEKGTSVVEPTIVQQLSFDNPLRWRSFVKETSLMQFLAERVKQEPQFKEQLLATIERSKKDNKERIAAANAITILIRAGVQFIRTDFRNIKIPGADLSFGVFDEVNLQGADLRKANLRTIWMRQANLTGAQMKGVHFGELPYLQEDSDVLCCTYSPDGKTFAAGLYIGFIILYDTSSWDKARTLKGHSDAINSISFSPAGDTIASGSDDFTVRLWKVGTGENIRIFEGHENSVSSIAYSPNGGQIASGSHDQKIRLWNVEDGNCVHIFQGHRGWVRSVVFSPEGDQIASGSDDMTVRLWEVNTRKCIHTLNGHIDYVLSVMFSPKGDRIASGSKDSTIALWNVKTGTIVRTLKGSSGSVSSVMYSPKGNRIASGSENHTVRLWNVETGKCVDTLYGHSERIRSVAYSPKGDRIASGSSDMTVRLWDVDADDDIHDLQGHNGDIQSVVYSPNGDRVASASSDCTMRLWDVETGKCIFTLRGHSNFVRSVVFSPEGDRLASGSNDYTVRLWDARTGKCVRTLPGHTSSVSSVVYSSKGDQIASGSDDGTIRLWDANNGVCVHTLKGHTDLISSVVFSPQGGIIASGSYDKTVRLWDVKTGRCTHEFLDHIDSISSVVFSPEGDQIVSGSYDNTARLWNVIVGRCVHTLNGHSDYISSVAFSPKGGRVASASDDFSVKVWNTYTGEIVYDLRGHEGPVLNVIFSSQGDWIASGSCDSTVRLWDVETGQFLTSISSCSYDSISFAFGNIFHGRCLVTGNNDGSVCFWRISDEEGKHKTTLCWISSHVLLTVKDVSFDDDQDLSTFDRKLLIQRGSLVPDSLKSQLAGQTE